MNASMLAELLDGRRARPALWLLAALVVSGCPTRGTPIAPGSNDGGDPLLDVPPPDVPPLGPTCRTPTPTPRTDPCPGRASCDRPSQARVAVTGARSTLTEFQVQVTLPAAVLSAVGPACDRMVFRTATGAWAPHFVTDCAAGTVWVRVPEIPAAGANLTLHYGGTSAVAGANSYDDTFDRVPTRGANLLGTWTFDEGTGTRACPTTGTEPFDAYTHDTPVVHGTPEAAMPPELWSREAPPSILAPTNPAARFTRNQWSLNFPRMQVIPDRTHPTQTQTGRIVNWRTEHVKPFQAANMQLTVGVWVYTETPANIFKDNFQTVICAGWPEHATPPFPGAMFEGSSIFNPWAIFFRSDDSTNSFLQGNTCVYPCLNVDQYAHVTTRRPFTAEEFAHRWHFAAMTVDITTTPHATRRSYFDSNMYEFPRDLDLWPQERYCPGGVCRYPPDTPIQYYAAPVIIGADMNGGEAQLGLEGKVDDLFVFARAVSPDEMRAYRERRAYSPDPVMATVTP
ncbi:MAG: hypothetical protein U0326_04965 [Polyangiales bacterium]